MMLTFNLYLFQLKLLQPDIDVWCFLFPPVGFNILLAVILDHASQDDPEAMAGWGDRYPQKHSKAISTIVVLDDWISHYLNSKFF